jgi:hypothetical protein
MPGNGRSRARSACTPTEPPRESPAPGCDSASPRRSRGLLAPARPRRLSLISREVEGFRLDLPARIEGRDAGRRERRRHRGKLQVIEDPLHQPACFLTVRGQEP